MTFPDFIVLFRETGVAFYSRVCSSILFGVMLS